MGSSVFNFASGYSSFGPFWIDLASMVAAKISGWPRGTFKQSITASPHLKVLKKPSIFLALSIMFLYWSKLLKWFWLFGGYLGYVPRRLAKGPCTQTPGSGLLRRVTSAVMASHASPTRTAESSRSDASSFDSQARDLILKQAG